MAAELATTMDVPAALAAEFAAEAPPTPEEVKAKAPAAPEAPPSPSQLKRLADAAAAAGKKVFTLPEGAAVPVGTTCTIFYDRSKGPLPGNAVVALKVGDWVAGR